jgi:glycosyltransferase involved in cell wall biosynthesis
MACGRPVACSDNSAVHEVADSCAVLFDANSKEQMARAMLDLALDAELRARMGRLSLKRSALFTWRKAAEKTLEVYCEVATASVPVPRMSVSFAK